MDERSVKILNCSGDAKKTIEKIDSSKLLNLDTKNCSRMELFLFALALGVKSGIETDLSKTETLVRGEYINTKAEAFLYSTFIADLDTDADLEKVNDINQVYNKVQRYANTGFKLIEEYFEKSENVVQLQLLRELDEEYEKIQDELN